MKRKTVHVLRHAHSTYNEKVDSGVYDDTSIDVGLSDLGAKQVLELSARPIPKFDLIATSPLSRCIDTALGVFGNGSTRLTVNPLLRERLEDWCDIGSPTSELQRKYPELNFGDLDERWWYEGPEDDRGIPVESRESVLERVDALNNWITGRRENTILLVSHSGFLLDLTGLRLPNCELHLWKGSTVH